MLTETSLPNETMVSINGHVTNGQGNGLLHSLEKNHAPQLFSLSNRCIIVTGATGGLGYSITEALLQSGADVIAIDRDETPSNENWNNLQVTAKKAGRELRYRQCDVSSVEDTRLVFEEAVSECRYPFRGIVTCAGIGWLGASVDFPIDQARKIIDVNLIGTLVCAQAGFQLAKKQGISASFVFIASMSGYVVNKGTPNAAYAASKAGVQQLARNLAAEWGHSKDGYPSVRVNTVSPGVIRTPMTSGILEDQQLDNMWTEMTFLKRLAEPNDFRGPVIFLLSEASGYVTGTDLLVDGGYTAA